MALQSGIAPRELLETPKPVFDAILRRLAERADEAERAELRRHLKGGF